MNETETEKRVVDPGHLIRVTPVNAAATPVENMGSPSMFKVHIDGEHVGYSEVKMKLDAGEHVGTLILIRAEHEGDDPKKVIYEDGVEGAGYKLLIRRFYFDRWGIDGPSLLFRGCRRSRVRCPEMVKVIKALEEKYEEQS